MSDLLALARENGQPRLETASALRGHFATRGKSVQSILETSRDLLPTTTELGLELPTHENVRGPRYYH